MLDGYQEKTPSCFECEQAEMLVMIPDHIRRVLDIRFALRERAVGHVKA